MSVDIMYIFKEQYLLTRVFIKADNSFVTIENLIKAAPKIKKKKKES